MRRRDAWRALAGLALCGGGKPHPDGYGSDGPRAADVECVVTLTKGEFRELCRHAAIPHGADFPEGLDPFAAFWMLGSCESNLGAICSPRFEPAYSWNRKGKYASEELHRLYGDTAACSYGPWQVMFANARLVAPEVTPAELMADPLRCALVTADFLDREMKRWRIETPEALLRTWNTGRPDGKTYADWYVPRGLKAYAAAKEAR